MSSSWPLKGGSSSLSVGGVVRVWRRFLMTLTGHIGGTVVNDLLTPVLQLIAYGYGVGALVGTIQLQGEPISYTAFMICGLYASRSLWQGFFRGSYGAYMRMIYERLYSLIPSSPITLAELVIGEIAWGATMSAFSGIGILLIGVLGGEILWQGLPLAFLCALLGGWIFTSLGLVCAALAKDIHQLEYPFNMLVMPISLFSGVYFPIQLMPAWSQHIADLLPLTPIVGMTQSALLGLPFMPHHLLQAIFWGLLLSWLAVWLVRRKIQS